MDVTAFNNIQNSTTALSTAVQGARRAETKFSEAATDLVNSFASAANVVSGADLSPEALAAASDPISPIVNMATSQRAYEANLKVFTAVDEMQESLLDTLA